MSRTTRRSFTQGLSAAVAAAAQTPPPRSRIYDLLVKANDQLVTASLLNGSSRLAQARVRRNALLFESYAAAYCAAESIHHRSDAVRGALTGSARAMVQAQHPDGTIDSGNLHSPPDTAFAAESVATALTVLRANKAPAVDAMNAASEFLMRASTPLVTGGVHTPNHRWVICAALARIHSLFPDSRYTARIEDWLGEGIDIDSDGQYSERSTGVYARVTNRTLITVARLLKRRELLEPVRRNLEMTAYYMHPDGELETVASRRQDAGRVARISAHYLEYRYLAILSRSALCGAVARFIEDHGFDELLAEDWRPQAIDRRNPLPEFLENPELRADLPVGDAVPTGYTRVFPGTDLARVRRGEVSATVYAGADSGLGSGSGLSSNPTFFTLRKGKAVLESVRLSSNFFSLGPFVAQGLEHSGGAFLLYQKFEAPYYQPLPADERRADGKYALTPSRDRRYWSNMNFPARPVSDVRTLKQAVSIREQDGAFQLEFDVAAEDRVPVTIELAFRPGGVFSGDLQELQKDRAWLLREGTGVYRVGDDRIEFGPGQWDHRSVTAGQGLCVYITGTTPFRRTLLIRAV